MKKLIYNLYNKSKDTYGTMLLAISDVPMVTTDMLKDQLFFATNNLRCGVGMQCDQMGDAILFTDLHLGLNIEHSYFYYGYQYNALDFIDHKCSSKDATSSGGKDRPVLFIDALATHYRSFQRYLLGYLHRQQDLSESLAVLQDADKGVYSHHPAISPKNTLVIHRHDNRVILNLEDVVYGNGHLFDDLECSGCDETGGIVEHFARRSNGVPFEVYNLQYTAFRLQTQLFANTRILVATAGTLFLRVCTIEIASLLYYFVFM